MDPNLQPPASDARLVRSAENPAPTAATVRKKKRNPRKLRKRHQAPAPASRKFFSFAVGLSRRAAITPATSKTFKAKRAGEKATLEASVKGTEQFGRWEQDAPVKIEGPSGDALIIAVVGPTGTGKSSFIHTATGGIASQSIVGCTLEAHTGEIEAIKFRHMEMDIVFLDTPGFNDTYECRSDSDILMTIVQWLEYNYGPNIKLAGILWFHRISDNRAGEFPLKHVTVLKRLCGTSALRKTILTTTMWDDIEEEAGMKREDELKAIYWKCMIRQESKTVRYMNTPESARAILGHFLPTAPSRRQQAQDSVDRSTGLYQLALCYREITTAPYQLPAGDSGPDIVIDSPTSSDGIDKALPPSESHCSVGVTSSDAGHAVLRESTRNPLSRGEQASQRIIDPEAGNLPRHDVLKRDPIALISPVARHPLLEIPLAYLHRFHTGHFDRGTFPKSLRTLSESIDRNEPTEGVADRKQKLRALSENLIFPQGEIIDMDLDDDNRSLLHYGHLTRKRKCRCGFNGWSDLFVALLDNYFVMTKRAIGPTGVSGLETFHRPIPLDFLRIETFDIDPETLSDPADIDAHGMHNSQQLFPFTVYHASTWSATRYTLYATSDAERRQWHDALLNAMSTHKHRQEAKMCFAQNVLDDQFFSVLSPNGRKRPGVVITGTVTSASSFTAGAGKEYIAVGCSTGVFISPKGDPRFRKVLSEASPTNIVALPSVDKFIVQFDSSIYAWSLDLVARVPIGLAPPRALEASMETIVDYDAMFFRTRNLDDRPMLVYAVKTFLQATLHHAECVHPDKAKAKMQRNTQQTNSFRPYGKPLSISRDAHNVTPLITRVAIHGEIHSTIFDYHNTSPSGSRIVTLPDLSSAPTSPPFLALKSCVDHARPLGVTRSSESEFLVIYDACGFYATEHGVPTRSAGYIRWETKATSYVRRGDYLLLFSEESIEIRCIPTGKFAQVILGENVRLLHTPCEPHEDVILAAMKGGQDAVHGRVYEKIVELVETGLSTGIRECVI